jgi:hypothetical protein
MPTTNMKRTAHAPFAKSLKLCAARRHDVNYNNETDEIRRELYSAFDKMQAKGFHYLKLNPEAIKLMIE